VRGSAPPALEDSLRRRRLSGRGGRPLNFTVRRHLELLKRFLQWFVSGVALACGVALVAWISTWLNKPLSAVYSYRELPINTVQVTSVEEITFTETLSVAAYIVSAASSHLEVRLQLDIEKDGQLLYSCPSQNFRYKRAGQPQRVQLDCRNLRRENIPKGARVSARVDGVNETPP